MGGGAIVVPRELARRMDFQSVRKKTDWKSILRGIMFIIGNGCPGRPAECRQVVQTNRPASEQQEAESWCVSLDSCDWTLGAKTAANKKAALNEPFFEGETASKALENPKKTGGKS